MTPVAMAPFGVLPESVRCLAFIIGEIPSEQFHGYRAEIPAGPHVEHVVRGQVALRFIGSGQAPNRMPQAFPTGD